MALGVHHLTFLYLSVEEILVIAMKVLFEHLLKEKLRNPSDFFGPSLKSHVRAIRGAGKNRETRSWQEPC
jgi:hypothetical protein